MPIREVIRRLQKNEYPASLTLFHKDHGTVSFHQMQPNLYLCYRRGPPLNGTREGIARSFGNLSMEPRWLLPHIDDIFGNIVTDVIALEHSARAKLLKLQLEAARKMMQESKTYVPRELENIVSQMIGEKKPVTGAYSVPNAMAKINTSVFNDEVNVPRHLKKINTTLFTNGGKRKSRRQRRKSTRRRR